VHAALQQQQQQKCTNNKNSGAKQNSLQHISAFCLHFYLVLNISVFHIHSNPNEHHRQDSVLPVSKERNRFRSITWENYDPLHQKYLEIGEIPKR